MFLNNQEYIDLNVKTAFAEEKTGIFEAGGFFDGSIIVKVNKIFLDPSVKSSHVLQEHSAPITDLAFIVTPIYGVIIQENTPTSSRLFLASSSLDQTIIIWQLYEGAWSVAKRFDYENGFCTSISANQSNEKIYFAFSDGETSYLNINDATKLNSVRKFDEPPVCLTVDFNSSNSNQFWDDNENEIIIIGNNKGEVKCSNGEELESLKIKGSKNRILYLDFDQPNIVLTYENGLVFVFDQYLSQTTEITPALKSIKNFKPIMAKFNKLTHAIKILGDNGQIATVMKFPNNTYQIME